MYFAKCQASPHWTLKAVMHYWCQSARLLLFNCCRTTSFSFLGVFNFLLSIKFWLAWTGCSAFRLCRVSSRGSWFTLCPCQRSLFNSLWLRRWKMRTGMIHSGGANLWNSSHGSMTAHGEGRAMRAALALAYHGKMLKRWQRNKWNPQDIRGACRLSFNLFYMSWCGFSCDLWWIFEER